MKYVVILGDGMADYKQKNLGNKTPLMLAKKPCINGLAEISEVGLCKTVPDGMKPGSDVANLSVLGYDPRECYTGRSPLEAASIGIELKATDVTARANLVTLSDEPVFEDKTMIDYSAGEISTEEAKTLIGFLAQKLNDERHKLYAGVSYRHCLIWDHGTLDVGTLTPPHDITGKPIKEYSLRTLRRKFGFVMQKSVLFSDTIANNIRWGKPDADDGEVRTAAATAQADSFIRDFAEGYDTFVAEKGASLSGGQKQRVSISRALVRRPEILILDDSTSALDLATEARLRSSLRSSLSDTTVIMVAQRIASVRDADRIAVIENDGSILHFAPHDVLMRESATYRDIYNSQMNNSAEGE